MIFLIIRSQ